MKKVLIYGSFLLVAATSFTACRKEDNPKLPALQKGIPVPQFVISPNSESAIDVTKDPAQFTAKFDLNLLYPNDHPQKMDVVVIKNGDKSNVKTLKADVTTFPTHIEVTGEQLETLFGSPIVLNDFFDIGANITMSNGTVLEAFPATGEPYAAGVAAIPNSSTLLRYTAICKFDADKYNGDFTVEEDEWGDYAVGSTVTVTKVSATKLSFMYAANNPKPIVIDVNPNNTVTVAKQVYGDSYNAPSPWPYGPLSVETVPSLDNVVLPCDGILSMRLKHTVAAGSFGEYTIKLKKK
jgi:hypothetical protein